MYPDYVTMVLMFNIELNCIKYILREIISIFRMKQQKHV